VHNQANKHARELVVEIGACPVRGRVQSILSEGTIIVDAGQSSPWSCDVLVTVSAFADHFVLGDTVLTVPPDSSGRGIVMGRIGLFGQARQSTRVVIDATQELTLNCGKSSINLRADGKVLIRGEDVLVRAKGTKRIRAGTVSIN
jgi:hypothetical protein